MPIADVEAFLVPWLAATLNVQAVTWLPADLVGSVPVVQVARIGGGSDDDLHVFDFPTVSINSFAVGRVPAFSLAASVDEVIRTTLPNTVHTVTAGTAVVTKTQTVTGPSWRPYDDITVRRFGATYQLHIRTR
jgi:hypothetical protein